MADTSRHPAKIAEMFDRISPTYDKVNRVLSFGQDVRWRKQMALHLPNKKNLSVLDIATGTADQLIALFEQSPKVKKGVGIDFAEKMLEIGRKKLAEKPYQQNVLLLKGDAEKIPFPDATFDATTISFGIRNVSNVPKALAEMRRVLHPKGKSLILEFSLPKNSLLKFLHLFYLRGILPKIGGFLSKSPASYSYLNQTIEEFPYGKAFLTLMEKAGFKNVSATTFMLGGVTLYEGEK